MILKKFVEIMTQNDSRKTLRTLFEKEKYDYIYIPRIQRDYAQGRIDSEATVIRDNILDDVTSCEPLSWGIIFGVSEKREMEDGSRKKCFIPIDGQQRLTTLYLLTLYGARKHYAQFEHLDGFNYETRSASRDFLTALVENWCGEKEEGKDLKEHILNQGWFLNYWAFDPTVNAVLNMLNVIDLRFGEIPEVFENLERISFEFLDLNNLSLNETLYLKMNSRGKKLSQFDKIKSEIDKILPNEMPKEFDCGFSLYKDETSHIETFSSFTEKWRYCIDREWSNLFWDKKSHNFDIPLLAFFSNWLVVCAGEKYQHTDNLVNMNYKDNDFFLPWKYFGYILNDTNAKKYFWEIASLLNKLCYNRNLKVVEQLISIPTSYPQRALQFGLLSFEGNDYSSKEFAEWKRFIRNYSVNAVNDKESFFAFINRIRKDFACHSTNILPHLASVYEQKVNEPNMQLREEYFKAKILDCNNELSPMIRKAEEHPMLNGRLRPLIIDGDKFDETTFIKIWLNFLKWFGEDGNALVFKEDDAESLRKRSSFARAFTKQVVRQNQLFDDWRVLDFAAGTLKDRLQRERFNKIFRTCLLSDNLDDIEELQCENDDNIEFIQAKEVLLQPGVIEGILKWDIGSRLRFRWYHNSLCFYPDNGRTSTNRIGFDRNNNNPGWDRNRNYTLDYLLQSKLYIIDAMPVSYDKSVALWWGSDIRFYRSDYPDIILWWNENYNLGIINKETNKWIKRRIPIENKNPNFMFGTVGMTKFDIKREIDTLIHDYLEEQKELLIERE